MRAHDRFVTLAFAAFTAAALMANRPAGAASIASDNACNSPYNGITWSNGQNGGSGFGAWSLFQTGGGNSSFFADTASNNGGSCASGGGINGSCGKSWGAFANNGAIANARRVFTGSPSSLQANQSFTFSLDNGYVNNSGGAIGVALENSSSNTVWEFQYVGGNPGGHYSINDGSGSNATSVGYLESGLVVVFTLTSSTTYSVTITPVGASTTTVTGTLRSPVGGQSISQFRFYNNEPLSGNGCNYNCFLNALSVGCPTFTVSAPDNPSVCVGDTASFSVRASGVNTPTYQWQVSTDGGVIWNPVSSGTGGTTTNYTTAASVAGDNGKMYRCVVTAACGNTIASAAATLTVIAAPSITTQPTAQIAYTGGSASFTVVASATGNQWYKGPTGSGVALSNGGSISGATSNTLTLSNLTAGDNGATFYVVVSGCGGPPQTSTGAGLIVTSLDPFLKANGLNIRNGHGTGDIVPLRGANLGAWLLMEDWMCPMDSGTVADHYSVVATLDSRFGVTTEQSLIRTFQNAWITIQDLNNIKALGMNLIRVPIIWTGLQQLDGTWRADAFDRLDWVVSNAWQRGIYTILDMHGAPGGVAPTQSAGTSSNAYWTSTAYKTQTAMIWSNIAAHYVGNPAVAGYDLLNEPYGAPSRQAIWDAYNSLYQTIRAVDPDHILIMEDTWSGAGLNWQWDVLPSPSTYHWSNVVYSAHAYAGASSGVQAEVNKQTSDFVNHQSWNVPCLIGEFQGYGTASAWPYAVTNFNKYGMSWCTWAYKATAGTVGNSWGIYDPNSQPGQPNLQTDSATTISNDWRLLTTQLNFAITPMLQQYLGGPLAVADSYSTTSGVTLAVNSGSGVLANDTDINLGQSGIQLSAVLVSGPASGQLSLNSNGSFSYVPNGGFTGTDTFRYRVYDNYQTSVNIATVTIQVNPANTPPTISSIGDQVINQDTVAGPINFTVGDIETSAGSLTVSGVSSNLTLVPNGNIVFGGSGANRTVTVTPAAGQTGATLITVSVSDGQLSSNTSFSVTVNPVNNPSPFEQWQLRYFGCTNCPEAQAFADPLGKGTSNTNQYLLGLNPMDPASTFAVISIAPEGPDMVITWKTAGVRTNAVQASSSDSYSTDGFADITGPIVINVSGDTTTNYTDVGGATNALSRLYRVRLVP